MYSDIGIGYEVECVNSCYGEEFWFCVMFLIGYGLCDDM